jgi:hypothetical protein
MRDKQVEDNCMVEFEAADNSRFLVLMAAWIGYTRQKLAEKVDRTVATFSRRNSCKMFALR